MRQVPLAWGLLPLAPLPKDPNGKWSCWCPRCGKVTPTRYTVLANRRTLDPCRHCSYRVRNRDLAVPEEVARAEFLAVGLVPDPAVRYENSHTGWASVCLASGHRVSPRLANIRSRGQGCDECARPVRGAKRRLDEEIAVAAMRAGGFEPLEPYPGSGVGWRSRCTASGEEVYPTLDNVRGHGHCCAECGTHGLDWDGPALVYLLHHRGYGALKVGVARAVIARRSEGRVRRLCRIFGWEPVRVCWFPTGRAAYAVEQQVLAWWRIELGLPPFLGSEETEGHTETVDAEVGWSPVWLRILAGATGSRGGTTGHPILDTMYDSV